MRHAIRADLMRDPTVTVLCHGALTDFLPRAGRGRPLTHRVPAKRCAWRCIPGAFSVPIPPAPGVCSPSGCPRWPPHSPAEPAA